MLGLYYPRRYWKLVNNYTNKHIVSTVNEEVCMMLKQDMQHFYSKEKY